MPSSARAILGLVPGDSEHMDTGWLDGDHDDPVRRREFLAAGAAVAAATASGRGPSSDMLGAVSRLGDSLLSHALPISGSDRQPAHAPGLDRLTQAVGVAKRRYQACEYELAANALPELLTELRAASEAADSDTRVTVARLSADAYHVTASLMLKVGDHALAWVAADRCMRDAERSEDPLALGSSTRILTHALLASGQPGRAASVAQAMAADMSTRFRGPTLSELSVYGALLLRGAIAAARQYDRSLTYELLDEASDAGRWVGADSNHYWTAFGPTNVLLHRIHIAVTLWDAGQAIELARTVHLDDVEVAERRVNYWLDLVRAFSQCRRYADAVGSLERAERLAPEEVYSRPYVRDLIIDLRQRTPRGGAATSVREIAARAGVDAR